MSNNSLIATTNYLQSATLTSGTGGSAPALEEVAPYTTTKCQTADRETVWKTSASPSTPVQVDFDLGSAKACTVAAVLGYRAPTTAAVTTVLVQSSSTATYPRTWTTRGTITLTSNPRDAGAIFASVSARYWRFEFYVTGRFQVGRLFLGSYTDLGGISAPGGTSSPYRNRNEQPFPSGVVLIEDLGDAGREITLSFPAKSDTIRSYFENITNQTGTLVYVDPDANVYEMYAPGGRTEHVRRFYGPSGGLYDLSVRLMRCP